MYSGKGVSTKYKAILFDVDGTLFDKEREYSRGFLAKLNELNYKAVKLSLATARSKYFINSIVTDLNIIDPIIIENGIAIFDPTKKEYVAVEQMDKSIFRVVYDLLMNKSNYRLGINTTRGFYVNQMYYKELSEYIGTQELMLIDSSFYIGENVILSFWIRDLDIKTYRDMKNIVAKYGLSAFVENNQEKYSIFLYNSHVGKQNGFIKWTDYCKINPEEVIFFGDSDSDVEISQACGLGCAVGNASDKLKSVSKIVANKNHSEGILEILNLLF